MTHDRLKKTLLGVGMALAGILLMLGSPYVSSDQLHLSIGTVLVSYTVIFLAGFVILMVGTGLILIENNLWGELHR